MLIAFISGFFLLISSPSSHSGMAGQSDSFIRMTQPAIDFSNSDQTSHSVIVEMPDSRDLNTNIHLRKGCRIPISNKYRSDKREYRFAMNDRLHHRICVSGHLEVLAMESEYLRLTLDESDPVQDVGTILTVEKRE